MTSEQRWQSSAKWTLVAVVAVVVVGGLGFYWLFLRGDAPERAQLPVRPTGTTVAGGPAVGSPDGQWRLSPGDGIFVGYRVQEQFAGDTIEKTAVGRTIAVSGSMAISADQVTAVSVEADMTRLTSDQRRRDDYIRQRGLETDTYGTATFTLTEPIALPAQVPTGEPFDLTAKGELTLHGTTRPVEMALEAQWDGTVIDVAGGTHIVMADYGMEPPSNSIVSVADEGELGLQLSFTRAT
jgi:polyisoprenoid-binding protein YceI